MRRVVTVGTLFLLAALLVVLLPLWVPVSLVVDLARGHRRLPVTRLLLFALVWSIVESAGVIGLFVLWATGQGRNLPANYGLQRLWCGGIVAALRVTVGLRLEIEGVDHGHTGPLIVFCRHASLADSIISCYVVNNLMGYAPRYVLKSDLQTVPCLDILGHRMPNTFVRRGSGDIATELATLGRLATGLGEKQAVVIFPEGSRANSAKRTRELERLGEKHPHRHEILSGLSHMIPPKPAGARALAEAAPQADVLVLWHEGLDGLDTFPGMLAALADRRVTARFRAELHPRRGIPVGDGFEKWLDETWAEADRKVAGLSTAGERNVNNG